MARSACLSASDFDSDVDAVESPSPCEGESPDPEPSEPEPELPEPELPEVEVVVDSEVEVAPLAPAREVDFMVLRPTARTLTFLALALLRRLALALSFSTDSAKEPPMPTCPPAAAALAVISRNIAFWAETSRSP